MTPIAIIIGLLAAGVVLGALAGRMIASPDGRQAFAQLRGAFGELGAAIADSVLTLRCALAERLFLLGMQVAPRGSTTELAFAEASHVFVARINQDLKSKRLAREIEDIERKNGTP